MRMCYYRFVDFCHNFLEAHLGYFLTPLRVNGSAIEAMFSQLKEGSGGTLTAASYSSARAKLLTKRAVHGSHVKDNYRNVPLYIQEAELPSKKAKKNVLNNCHCGFIGDYEQEKYIINNNN